MTMPYKTFYSDRKGMEGPLNVFEKANRIIQITPINIYESGDEDAEPKSYPGILVHYFEGLGRAIPTEKGFKKEDNESQQFIHCSVKDINVIIDECDECNEKDCSIQSFLDLSRLEMVLALDNIRNMKHEY